MEKFKKNGWIRESNSACGARAFVVPKPGRPGEYRMVVNYRHLNLMTEDDCHPIRNIEDIISAESQNTLWSIFNLEDGFHQMHLSPEASPLTSFVTPCGQFEWTVMPMGIKNGPSMFQSMVSHVLKETKESNIRIDDCLTGTEEQGSPQKTLEAHDKAVRKCLECF